MKQKRFLEGVLCIHLCSILPTALSSHRPFGDKTDPGLKALGAVTADNAYGSKQFEGETANYPSSVSGAYSDVNHFKNIGQFPGLTHSNKFSKYGVSGAAGELPGANNVGGGKNSRSDWYFGSPGNLGISGGRLGRVGNLGGGSLGRVNLGAASNFDDAGDFGDPYGRLGGSGSVIGSSLGRGFTFYDNTKLGKDFDRRFRNFGHGSLGTISSYSNLGRPGTLGRYDSGGGDFGTGGSLGSSVVGSGLEYDGSYPPFTRSGAANSKYIETSKDIHNFEAYNLRRTTGFLDAVNTHSTTNLRPFGIETSRDKLSGPSNIDTLGSVGSFDDGVSFRAAGSLGSDVAASASGYDGSYAYPFKFKFSGRKDVDSLEDTGSTENIDNFGDAGSFDRISGLGDIVVPGSSPGDRSHDRLGNHYKNGNLGYFGSSGNAGSFGRTSRLGYSGSGKNSGWGNVFASASGYDGSHALPFNFRATSSRKNVGSFEDTISSEDVDSSVNDDGSFEDVGSLEDVDTIENTGSFGSTSLRDAVKPDSAPGFPPSSIVTSHDRLANLGSNHNVGYVGNVGSATSFEKTGRLEPLGDYGSGGNFGLDGSLGSSGISSGYDYSHSQPVNFGLPSSVHDDGSLEDVGGLEDVDNIENTGSFGSTSDLRDAAKPDSATGFRPSGIVTSHDRLAILGNNDNLGYVGNVGSAASFGKTGRLEPLGDYGSGRNFGLDGSLGSSGISSGYDYSHSQPVNFGLPSSVHDDGSLEDVGGLEDVDSIENTGSFGSTSGLRDAAKPDSATGFRPSGIVTSHDRSENRVSNDNLGYVGNVGSATSFGRTGRFGPAGGYGSGRNFGLDGSLGSSGISSGYDYSHTQPVNFGLPSSVNHDSSLEHIGNSEDVDSIENTGSLRDTAKLDSATGFQPSDFVTSHDRLAYLGSNDNLGYVGNVGSFGTTGRLGPFGSYGSGNNYGLVGGSGYDSHDQPINFRFPSSMNDDGSLGDIDSFGSTSGLRDAYKPGSATGLIPWNINLGTTGTGSPASFGRPGRFGSGDGRNFGAGDSLSSSAVGGSGLGYDGSYAQPSNFEAPSSMNDDRSLEDISSSEDVDDIGDTGSFESITGLRDVDKPGSASGLRPSGIVTSYDRLGSLGSAGSFGRTGRLGSVGRFDGGGSYRAGGILGSNLGSGLGYDLSINGLGDVAEAGSATDLRLTGNLGNVGIDTSYGKLGGIGSDGISADFGTLGNLGSLGGGINFGASGSLGHDRLEEPGGAGSLAAVGSLGGLGGGINFGASGSLESSIAGSGLEYDGSFSHHMNSGSASSTDGVDSLEDVDSSEDVHSFGDIGSFENGLKDVHKAHSATGVRPTGNLGIVGIATGHDRLEGPGGVGSLAAVGSLGSSGVLGGGINFDASGILGSSIAGSGLEYDGSFSHHMNLGSASSTDGDGSLEDASSSEDFGDTGSFESGTGNLGIAGTATGHAASSTDGDGSSSIEGVASLEDAGSSEHTVNSEDVDTDTDSSESGLKHEANTDSATELEPTGGSGNLGIDTGNAKFGHGNTESLSSYYGRLRSPCGLGGGIHVGASGNVGSSVDGSGLANDDRSPPQLNLGTASSKEGVGSLEDADSSEDVDNFDDSSESDEAKTGSAAGDLINLGIATGHAMADGLAAIGTSASSLGGGINLGASVNSSVVGSDSLPPNSTLGDASSSEDVSSVENSDIQISIL